MSNTVLVIDDQWSMQELARIVLQTAGFRVLLAGDGVTGLSLARAEHPQAIVLDAHMSGMSGLEVLHALRQDVSTAGIPVILIIREANDDVRAQCLRTGDLACLQKPFHPPALLTQVGALLHDEGMKVAV